MIQLASKNLSANASSRLADLQRSVDVETTFERKTVRAISLWDSKNGSTVGKTTFKEVRDTLATMCVSVEVCNYCEQNEANDIEHIYPKSLFPGKTFDWENYLLACKQCNTAYKLDSFAVLDDNNDLVDIPRGTEPPNQNGAFINPRTESPSAYMMMNLGSFKFELMPDLSKANRHKANKTLEVLQLNDRDTLIEARNAAVKYYYHRMEMLSRVLMADTVAEVEAILTPYDDYIGENLSLEQLKANIKAGFKRDIQRHQHPSVWYAVKTVESKTNAKWTSLFENIPEALEW